MNERALMLDGIRLERRSMACILYADDMLLMSTSKDGLQRQLNIVT